MRIIDKSTWKRRSHFEFFSAYDYPEFNIVAEVDATALIAFCEERGSSVFLATVYLLTRAANEVPELRTRIREGGQVIEHEVVHPAFTVLNEDELFNFCTTTYHEDSRVFFEEARREIEETNGKRELVEDEPGRDDLLFMTCVPWVAFSGVQHPIRLGGGHSIPKVAWGKIVSDGGKSRFSVGLQAHHGLCDGVHAGRFFDFLQRELESPESAIR